MNRLQNGPNCRYAVAQRGTFFVASLMVLGGFGVTWAIAGPMPRAGAQPNPPTHSAYVQSREHFEQGRVAYQQGDNERAIAEFSQAVELQPDFVTAYYRRGLAYRRQGQENAAIRDFRTVLNLTQDPELRQNTEQQLLDMRTETRAR
jgi:tetratricopeptide (TPR) repeat protein